MIALLSYALGLLAVPSILMAPDDLLDFLIVQNEAARQKIKSVGYKMDIEFKQNAPGGVFTGSGTREEKRDGGRGWMRKVESHDYPHPRSMPEIDFRTIFNERIVAQWGRGLGNVLVYENEGPGSMSLKGERIVSGENGMSPLSYGFGDGSNASLREVRDTSDPSIWKFTVEEVTDGNGDLLYRIVRTGIDGVETTLSNAWEVDPARGFLITRMTAYFNGKPWGEVRVEVGEVPDASGVWFPLEIEKTMHEGVLQGEPRSDPSFYFHGSVTEVEVNRTYDDVEFELEALGHPQYSVTERPNGVHVIWEGPDGSTTLMEYFRGQLVPSDIARQLLAAESDTLSEIAKSTSVEVADGAQYRRSQLERTRQDSGGAPTPSAVAEDSHVRRIIIGVIGGLLCISLAVVLFQRGRGIPGRG